MFWSGLAALASLQAASALTPSSAALLREGVNARIVVKDTKAFAPASELKPADKVVQLKHKRVNARSSRVLSDVVNNGTAPLNPSSFGASYSIAVTLGDETYDAIFDTGSSDLWFARSNVECVDYYFLPQPVEQCEFGPLFDGDFDGGRIPDQTFNITYGDGEFLTGDFGYEDVTVAGVEVERQQLALVDFAYWIGDGETSGLIGFAYPALTSAYEGEDPELATPETALPYRNFVNNAIAEGSMAPVFSHVLERGPDGGSGQLALGGLPDIAIDRSAFASAPLQRLELTPLPSEIDVFTYYTILPEAILLATTNATLPPPPQIDSFPTIIDSGTTLAYLPPTLVQYIASAFSPPAQYSSLYGIYLADCDATLPGLGLRIGGEDFWIDGRELLLTGELGYDSVTDSCIVGVQPAFGGGPYVLGGTFLKSVVAVYDLGASEMRFAPYEY